MILQYILSCWSKQLPVWSLTFLSLGNPLILIILPDIFSDSFQLKSPIFLYFSTPPVSSTNQFIFKGQ